MSENQFDFTEQEDLVTEIVDTEVKEVAPLEFVTKDYAEEKGLEVPTSEESVSEEQPQVEEAPEAKVEEAPEAVIENPIITEETKVKDAFEELGFTEENQKEYLKKIAEAIKTNTLNELIQNLSVNYDNMNEAELLELQIKDKIKSEYPNISDKALKVALEKEKNKILDEYDITSDDEETAEAGLELLKLRMDKVREEYKSKQAAYQPPKYEPKSEVAPQNEELEKARQEFVSKIEKSAFISEVERTKVVAFGEFKMDVPQGFDPKGQTINVNSFLSKFFDKDGNIDETRWVKTMAFGENPDKVAQDLINYGKSLKEKEQFESLRGIKNKELDSVPNNGGGEYVITDVRYTN